MDCFGASLVSEGLELRTLLLPTPGHPGVIFFRVSDSEVICARTVDGLAPLSATQTAQEEDDTGHIFPALELVPTSDRHHGTRLH